MSTTIAPDTPTREPTADGLASGRPAGSDAGPRRRRLDAAVAAWIAVAALLAGLVASPPWRVADDALLPAGAAALLLEGDLERQVDGAWTPLRAGDLVPSGSTVRTDAGARLGIDAGALELAGGTQATLADAYDVETGSVLVDSPDRERELTVGRLTAAGTGLWRADANAVRRVGVYLGQVEVGGTAAGTLAVDRYAQADLTGDQLPARSLPLRYETDDAWDGRFLGALFAVDRQAEALRRGFEGRFGTAPLPASRYQDMTDMDAAVAFDGAPGAGVGPPGEVLVSLAAVRALEDRAGVAYDEAVREVADLRRDGASWGVVLARRDLVATDLRDVVDAILAGTATGTVATPGGGEVAPPAGDGTGAPPADDAGEQPPREPTDDAQPPPAPDDEPAPGPCQHEVCEPANETVDGLTDVLDDVVPGAGEQVDDVVREVPTVVPSDS